MRVAMASGATGFSEYNDIVSRHGFMAFPQFIDNNWVAKKRADVKFLERHLTRYAIGVTQFAVAPDLMPEEAERLRVKYDVNWIYPLHSRDEDISKFQWIGYPHMESRRDYDLNEFLKLTRGKKRWYLGWWDSTPPNLLFLFDGVDTTQLNFLGGKKGECWLDWGKHEDVEGMSSSELIELNILNFKKALVTYQNSVIRTPTLDTHFRQGL